MERNSGISNVTSNFQAKENKDMRRSPFYHINTYSNTESNHLRCRINEAKILSLLEFLPCYEYQAKGKEEDEDQLMSTSANNLHFASKYLYNKCYIFVAIYLGSICYAQTVYRADMLIILGYEDTTSYTLSRDTSLNRRMQDLIYVN
ncbi:hypothetical protein GJ496_002100 [Pomphorhynchus laevis]|nr:hypothetical protein GJ496_002100 [Pomphorhynchus laevis]